jgi:DNA invertase Pin-like site-specific DNA recombinase
VIRRGVLETARRRTFDVLLCWRLDRLGRNLRHQVVPLEELRAVGVAFVSLNEGIDATTPAGKRQLHVLAALAEFERERIRERVHAGLACARLQGTRPRKAPGTIRETRWVCARRGGRVGRVEVDGGALDHRETSTGAAIFTRGLSAG